MLFVFTIDFVCTFCSQLVEEGHSRTFVTRIEWGIEDTRVGLRGKSSFCVHVGVPVVLSLSTPLLLSAPLRLLVSVMVVVGFLWQVHVVLFACFLSCYVCNLMFQDFVAY